jgi:hypothetical protein
VAVIIVYNFRFLFILWFYHIFRLWLAVFVGTWIDCIGAVAESGTVRVAAWVRLRAAADAAAGAGFACDQFNSIRATSRSMEVCL